MDFEIKPTLKGLSVADGETNYLYKSKLFSMSAKLEDENGNVIARLKRSSWWRLAFILWTEKESYKLEQKLGDVILSTQSDEAKYRTNMTTVFYDKNAKMVTEFYRKKNFGLVYKLIIKETEDYLALLIASCMLYKLSIEGQAAG